MTEINWKDNLRIAWFGNFLTGASISLVVLFMLIFVENLGVGSEQVAFYAGLAISVSAIPAPDSIIPALPVPPVPAVAVSLTVCPAFPVLCLCSAAAAGTGRSGTARLRIAVSAAAAAAGNPASAAASVLASAATSVLTSTARAISILFCISASIITTA